MRLFTALWPPSDALAALAAKVGAAPDPLPPGWRTIRQENWHVTLAFYGEADPGVLARRLAAAARDADAPRLRLVGAGAFPGVVWVGVETAGAEDTAALHALVAHAGGDPTCFRPHVTVARAGGRARGTPPSPGWAGYAGPWWTSAEVILASSVPGRGGSRYAPVHRVPLRRH